MCKERRIGRRPILIALALVLIAVAIGALALMGGAAEPKPTLAIAGTSLSFKDNIYMNFYVSAENADELKLLIWEAPQSEYKIGTEQYRLTDSAASNGYKRFVFDEFAARQMTKEVYACAHTNVGGVDYYSDPFKFSMHTYAYGIINGGSAYSESMKALCREMLDYGAAAQVHFDGATARLANDNWLQIVLDGGLLSDGTSKGLYLQGDTINVTAPATDERGTPFSHWVNSKGESVSASASFTYTVGDCSETLTPTYGSFGGYTIICPSSPTDAMTMAAGKLYQRLSNAEASRVGREGETCLLLTVQEGGELPEDRYIRLCEAEEFESLYGKPLGMNDYSVHKISDSAVAISAGGIYALDRAIEAFVGAYVSEGYESALCDRSYNFEEAPDSPGKTRLDEILAVYNDPEGRMMSMANGGDHVNYPENSLSSIRSAIEAGVDIVKIDLKRTGDGRYVLMKDDTVDRTTDGSGSVSSMTYDQIRALRLKERMGGADASVTEQAVPTLEEVLALCKDRIMICLDGDANKFESADIDYVGEVYGILNGAGCVEQTFFRYGSDEGQITAVIDKLASVTENGRTPTPLFIPMYDGANCDGAVERVLSLKQSLPELKMVELGTMYYQADAQSVAAANRLSRERGVRHLYSAFDGIDDTESWSDLYSMGFGAIATDSSTALAEYVRAVSRISLSSDTFDMCNFVNASGVHIKNGVVDSISSGDTICYSEISFTGHESQMLVSAKVRAAGSIKIYTDSVSESTLVGSIPLVPGSGEEFELISGRLTKTVSGAHKILLVFEGKEDYIAELKLMTFREGGSEAVNPIDSYYECYVNDTSLPETVEMLTEGGRTVRLPVVWEASASYGVGTHRVSGLASGDIPVAMTLEVKDAVVIDSAEDWRSFALSVNSGDDHLGKHVILACDIDFSGEEFVSVGTADHPFSGSFDGRLHTLKNMAYKGESAAVFGYARYAHIYDLNVEGGSFESDGKYAATFVAYAEGTRIDNCIAVSCSVVATADAGYGGRGGFAGYVTRFAGVDSIISGCTAKAVSINASRDVGGFIGDLAMGMLYNCNVYRGSLTATGNSCGGFAGDVHDGSVYDCHAELESFVCGNTAKHLGAFVGYSINENRYITDNMKESVYVNCTWDIKDGPTAGIGTQANEAGYIGYMGARIFGIPSQLPYTLPGSAEYSSFLPKNGSVVSGAALIADFDTDIPSIKSHSTKGDWKIEAVSGARWGRALYMYAIHGAADGAGASPAGDPPEIADALLSQAVDITDYSGLMIHIDASGIVGELDTLHSNGYFNLAVPFDLSPNADGSGATELRSRVGKAYYLDADGDWILTNTVDDAGDYEYRFKIPTGFRGWIYLPFSSYETSSSKQAFSDYLAAGNRYLTSFRVYPRYAELSEDQSAVLVVDDVYAVGSVPEYSEQAEARGGNISIGGVPLSSYSIVIPEASDLHTKYAAQNLADYLKYNYGYELPVVTDGAAPTEHELLIGDTNRPGSAEAAAISPAEDEYVMMVDGDDVVLYGQGRMAGAAAAKLINQYAAASLKGEDVDITELPTTAEAKRFTYETARNAILLIGDGMGENQVRMTVDNGVIDSFAAYDMPNIGAIITRSQSVIDGLAEFTDSAAAGTALATGHKTLNGYIGIDPSKEALYNLRELAYSAGANTAILSTDAITGATPSAFLAHCGDRYATAELKSQIDGLILDGKVDRAVGSLGDSNFFSTSVEALQSISNNGESFFAMIEEGYIDKYAHANNGEMVMHCVDRFNELIAYSMQFTLFHPDTVLIVTADHETGGLTYEEGRGYYFTSDEHTNVNVPIYALGSGTELFDQSVYENTNVPGFIAKIFGDNEFDDPQYRGK